MNTVQERLRHFREEIQGLSLRDFQAAVNAHLAADETLSLGTISNYERAPSGGERRPGPRVGFLAALQRAFPELRLEWLILGEGRPTRLAEKLASPGGLEADAAGDGFAARVLARYPDLELLSPEASSLFMGALTRMAMSEPDMNVDEERLLELAGDLRWLVFRPLALWGFRHAPHYELFSSYAIGALHALMLLMPESGEGDPGSAYADSPGPDLRATHPVRI